MTLALKPIDQSDLGSRTMSHGLKHNLWVGGQYSLALMRKEHTYYHLVGHVYATCPTCKGGLKELAR